MSGYTMAYDGITLTAAASPDPAATPKGLIVTRALELKDGWVGQVIVAEEVVKEKAGFDRAQDAEEWATYRVTDAIKKLFK